MVAGLVLAGLGVAALGCAAAPPRSTRLTIGDFELLAAQMSTSLAASPLLRERGPTSEPMVITINRVENLSMDLIPRREQWALMSKVRSSAALVELGRARAFRVVLPAEFAALAGEPAEAARGQGVYAGRAPTHEIAATIRSATRSDGRNRTDVYLLDMRLTALATGELQWTDTFELKRWATGLSFD